MVSAIVIVVLSLCIADVSLVAAAPRDSESDGKASPADNPFSKTLCL